MPQYEIKVIVEYNYDVEAETPEEAEEQGWAYEDYSHFAEVYSIDVTEVAEEVYEDEDEE
jgi:hypothetical protein